ncbi:MAG TPA: hypothetical protein PL039_10330 [Kiritimatiellia bacterium]|jgi:hypothetical protein|nr:hypothetical protein [Kiritimatiellia bacterium]
MRRSKKSMPLSMSPAFASTSCARPAHLRVAAGTPAAQRGEPFPGTGPFVPHQLQYAVFQLVVTDSLAHVTTFLTECAGRKPNRPPDCKPRDSRANIRA